MILILKKSKLEKKRSCYAFKTNNNILISVYKVHQLSHNFLPI